MKRKKIFNTGIFILISLGGFSQLNMQQMVDIHIGEVFKESKPKIVKLFSPQPKIMKSDFLGAYKIIYEDQPFDFYGNVDYTFLYIKDTLVSVEVDFEFLSSQTYNFKRLYSTLIEDFSKDKSKNFKNEYSDLNYEKILHEIESECKKNSNPNDKNYERINVKSLGQNYWDIFSASHFANKFLRMSVSIGERRSPGKFITEEGEYYGCLVDIILKISSYNFLELQSQLNKFSVQYTEISNE